MDNTPSEQRSLVPPPALTRAAAAAEPTGHPLMPPFVAGGAAPSAPAAPRAEPLELIEVEAVAPREPIELTEVEAVAPSEPLEWVQADAPDPVERVDAELAIPVPAPDEADQWPSLSEQGSAQPAWDNGEDLGAAANFPLDAFIVPEDSERVPSGYQKDHVEQAERIAARLETISRHVRAGGIAQLESLTSDDELTSLIADVIAGYLHRGGHA